MTNDRQHSEIFRVRVRGDYACFTRPEMKVERVSYDVMTPSAARGVLEAVLWKPAIAWNITRIDVLRPIAWTSIRRNEVSEVASIATAKTAMKRGSGSLGINIEDVRQQRAALILRDVEYIIHAYFMMTDKVGPEDCMVKFEQMFRRRMEKGQHFHQPYLGCREFPAELELVKDADARGFEQLDQDLGWMLLDMNFDEDPPQARFFQARLENGSMLVPEVSSVEVVS
jgi:CRISPR-associated protein Cas5d